MEEEVNSITIEKSYSEALYEITGDVYQKLVDGKIVNYFTSLGELLETDASEMFADTSVNGFGESKKALLQNFQKVLENNREYYLRVHSVIQPFEIHVEENSFLEQLRNVLAIMHSYWKEREWLDLEMGYTKNKISCSEVLDLYYGVNENGDWTENSVIAEDFNCLPFNVDIVRLRGINLSNIFAGIDEHVKIVFSEANFHQQLSEILYQSKAVIKLDPEGQCDVELLDRYVGSFGFSIGLYPVGEKEFYYLVNKKNVGEFRENLRILIKTSKDELFSRNATKIIDNVKNSWEKDRFNFDADIITALIKGNQIFKQDFSNDEEKYFTKWSLLSGAQNKISRILFENDRPMYSDEIRIEYDERAMLNDIKTLGKIMKVNSPNIISRGNNVFAFGDKNDKVEPVWFIIERFAREKKAPFLLKELCQSINAEFNQYDEYTIKSYTTWKASCRSINQNKEFDYIHESFISDYPELKIAAKQKSGIGYKLLQASIKFLRSQKLGVSLGDLEQEIRSPIEKETGWNWRTSYFNDKIEQLLSQNYFEINEDGLLFANLERFDEKEIESIGKRSEPAYRTAIRAKIVDFLKETGNKPTLLTDLYKLINHLYPKEIAVNNFYKIFKDSELFIKGKQGTSVVVSLQLSQLPAPVANEEIATEEVVGVSPQELEKLMKLVRTPFSLEELLDQLSVIIESEYKLTGSQIKKGISRLRELYKEYNKNNQGFWLHYIFQKLHEVLNHDTDIFERRVCMTELSSSYETLVKRYVNFSGDHSTGIRRLLDHDPGTRKLKYYDRNASVTANGRIDFVMKKFSRILGKMLSMADAMRHDRDEESVQVNFEEGNQIKNIKDFIALYVYTSSIV